MAVTIYLGKRLRACGGEAVSVCQHMALCLPWNRRVGLCCSNLLSQALKKQLSVGLRQAWIFFFMGASVNLFVSVEAF